MNIFEYKFKKLLSGKILGDFNSYFKGDGIELQDTKTYTVGDDIRHINWKLSSKSKDLIVNLYKQPKEAEILVFFDINKNWSGYNGKYVVKEKIFSIFEQLLFFSRKYKSNIVVSYFSGNKINYKKIGNNIGLGRKVKNLIYGNIPRYKVFSFPNFGFKYTSKLSDFLLKEKGNNKKRIIIIFSDFLLLSDNDKKIIKYLQYKNELILFRFSLSNLEGLNYNKFNLNLKNDNFEKIFYDI
ncbi:DUF58 domain-containing protein [Candidatus Vampirococcus lugosii]|uniref:DUF58 domain-containing protein n=1 Tax=Candidatus Vampirococcus lugosii TaxID=2789015 RepID=A0ABS5QK34_9BACT|nr:DUF58 domain-containing protein [Candidatus Vampirococcus lugosii]MBS8121616.1 hypothetical protein [Candidatus Vampirococcus lugosii]